MVIRFRASSRTVKNCWIFRIAHLFLVESFSLRKNRVKDLR